MSGKKSFEIAFVGLKPGVHEYAYDITDKFFIHYDEQDFTNCKAEVKLKLEKSTGLLLLHFEIGGSLDITCDRCGNNLPISLWEDFNMVVKLVSNPEEMNDSEEDPDIYYLGLMDSHINVADWIYEFINLSIPMQRMCGEDEKGKSKCNPEVLQKLEEMRPTETQQEENSGEMRKLLERFKNLPEN